MKPKKRERKSVSCKLKAKKKKRENSSNTPEWKIVPQEDFQELQNEFSEKVAPEIMEMRRLKMQGAMRVATGIDMDVMC